MFDSLASQYGLAVAILIIGFLGFFTAIIRGDLVSGRSHEDMRTDRDYWRGVALQGLGTAEQSARVAEQALNVPPPRKR